MISFISPTLVDHERSKDYELKSFGGLLLVLNVCGGVHRDLFGNQDDNPAGFIRRGHGDFSIGYVVAIHHVGTRSSDWHLAQKRQSNFESDRVRPAINVDRWLVLQDQFG